MSSIQGKKIVCNGCHEVMFIIKGKIEVQEVNENPFNAVFCEECYRKQKELVERIRFMVKDSGKDMY